MGDWSGVRLLKTTICGTAELDCPLGLVMSGTSSSMAGMFEFKIECGEVVVLGVVVGGVVV